MLSIKSNTVVRPVTSSKKFCELICKCSLSLYRKASAATI